MQPVIIVIEPGSITNEAKKQLEESGIVIIETSEPDKIKILSPVEFGSAGDVFMAAMVAVGESSSTKATFATELLKRIKAASETKHP